MSVALGRSSRVRAARPHVVAAPDETLAGLTRGEVAQVVGVTAEAHPAVARRLFDLGFAPGTEVEVLRRAPMADPVVFRLAGYDVALRRSEARCIQVSAQR